MNRDQESLPPLQWEPYELSLMTISVEGQASSRELLAFLSYKIQAQTKQLKNRIKALVTHQQS